MKYARLMLYGMAALNVVACGNSQMGKSTGPSLLSNKANVYLELTDAPNDNIKSVYVNVDHAELRVDKGDRSARVIVGQNMGVVDLLTLRNGVTMPVDSLSIPVGTEVTQIRLVLKSEGNYIVKDDGSTCELRTPSAQKTGIKLLIHQGLPIEGGYTYRIVADFEADKSVVLLGNGGCLLKPVVKLKSVTRIVETPPPPPPPPSDPPPANDPPPADPPANDPPAEEPGEEPVPVTGDNSGDDGGFEEPGEDPVPVIGIDDLNWYML